MTLRASTLLLGLSLGLSGCAGADGDVELEQSAIVNGDVSDSRDDAVVQLIIPGGQSCTASLIAPNVVITALHCVTKYVSEGVFVCNRDGSLTTSTPPDGSIGDPIDPSVIQVRVGVEATSVSARGAKIVGTGAVTACSKDLAVVELDQTLDLPIASVRLERNTERGEYAHLVGYGQTEMTTSRGRHRRDGVRVLDVGKNEKGVGSTSAAPYTIVVGEGACHGDSGGPLLSEETGAVIGVYSLVVGSNCTTAGVRNVYTQVAPFASIIRRAVREAGYEPVLESDPAAGGQNAGGADPGGETPGAGGAASETGGTDGTGATPTTQGGTSSGSTPPRNRADSSCACRMLPSTERETSTALGAVLAFAAGVVGRRRGRRRR